MSNEFQAIPCKLAGREKELCDERNRKSCRKKTIKITLLVSWLLQLWPLSSRHRCTARLAKYKRKTNGRNFVKVHCIQNKSSPSSKLSCFFFFQMPRECGTNLHKSDRKLALFSQFYYELILVEFKLIGKKENGFTNIINF